MNLSKRHALFAGSFLLLSAVVTVALLRPTNDRPPPATGDAPAQSVQGSSTASLSPATAADQSTGSVTQCASTLAIDLFQIDFARMDRPAFIASMQERLATQVPADLPIGTTAIQDQQAALTELGTLVPDQGTWERLSADRVRDTFTVTAATTPPSWLQAEAAGEIKDARLSARTVTGFQTIRDGSGGTTTASQSVTLILLVPSGTSECQLVVATAANQMNS